MTTEPETTNASDSTLESPYPVPSDTVFEGDEFAEAYDLAKIAQECIAEHHDDLYHLKTARIEYLWRRKAQSLGGTPSAGTCQRTPPLVRHYNETDFTITIAADLTRDIYTREQIKALMFHQLLHIVEKDDSEDLKIRGHEFEGFVRELDVFGPWQSRLQRAADALQGRLDLDGAGGAV